MTKQSNQNNKNTGVENKINQSFKAYIEHVNIFFVNNSEKKIKHLDIYSNNKDKLEKLENGEKFSTLIDDTMKIDSPFIKSQIFSGSKDIWKYAVGHFFRRSNCYADILNGNVIDKDGLLENFLKSFKNKQTKFSYYALIELVHFPKKTLDFDSFKIRHFSKSELDTIFSSTINELYYPYVKIDSSLLRNYWFVCVTENKLFKKSSLDFDEKIKFNHSAFPKKIELALKKLTLFDWQCFEKENEWWVAPEIPYVFVVNDNLLSPPSSIVFDYRQLLTEPFIDSRTGEELGEKPVTFFDLDEEFEKFILTIENTFQIFQNNDNLNFIDNALGHFIKGFFAHGIEELLWHISTIEALLGDNSSGLTSHLARRSALIIEKEPARRKMIYAEFKQLYDFRSKLVHGNPDINKEHKKNKKNLNSQHLYKARNISRLILLWFLRYISNNIKTFENKKSENIQKEILETIDLEPEKIIGYRSYE